MQYKCCVNSYCLENNDKEKSLYMLSTEATIVGPDK